MKAELPTSNPNTDTLETCMVSPEEDNTLKQLEKVCVRIATGEATDDELRIWWIPSLIAQLIDGQRRLVGLLEHFDRRLNEVEQRHEELLASLVDQGVLRAIDYDDLMMDTVSGTDDHDPDAGTVAQGK